MRKSSWVILGVCLILAALLGFIYVRSQPVSETLTQPEAEQMLHQMQDAVAQKNVGGIMEYIAPDPETRIANLNQDQLRLLIARGLRNSGRPQAIVSNIVFAGGTGEATLAFDLVVKDDRPDSVSDRYTGHITLHLRRVEVSHLLGLFHTKEWRIVGADTTGPDLSNFGD